MRILSNQRDSLINCATGLVVATSIRHWMKTLDYKVLYHDPRTDPALSRPHQQRFIYVFWHEYILTPLYLRGHCDLCMMLSPHRDGHVLDRVAAHLGFGVVRGSSYARRVGGLKGMIEAGADCHLCLTPDGPRGPRRKLSPGAILMAARLQAPIVCLGFGIDRPWRLASWDRFAIPRPFSRVRCVIPEPIHVPKYLSPNGKEEYRALIEQKLNEVTQSAEQWAESRASHPGQISTRRASRAA